MGLRAEPIRDDVNLVALMYGPMVMAADLGPAGGPFEGVAPVLVGETTAGVVGSIGHSTIGHSTIDQASIDQGKSMTTGSTSQPPNLQLKPFFSQYDRRSAVYFPRLTEPQWHAEQSAREVEQARVADLEARSVDVFRFGDQQSEHDHELKESASEEVLYRGRNGRLARNGAFFEFRMRSSDRPLMLQATYWGKQRNSRFKIFADGVHVATDSSDGSGPIAFVERSYELPTQVTQGKQFVVIRFEPEANAGTGPVFGCRLLPAPAATTAATAATAATATAAATTTTAVT
jgi:hypothetical protein